MKTKSTINDALEWAKEGNQNTDFDAACLSVLAEEVQRLREEAAMTRIISDNELEDKLCIRCGEKWRDHYFNTRQCKIYGDGEVFKDR